MRLLLLICLCAILLTVLAFLFPPTLRFASTGKIETSSPSPLSEAYGRLPLSFEANHGQADREVKFISRGRGYSLFLTSTEAVLGLRIADCGLRNEETGVSPVKSGNPQSAIHNPHSNNPQSTIRNPQLAVLEMRLIGANAAPQLVGLDQLPGKVNYFIGNDPGKWQTDIPTYAKIKYQDVYPGVDLVYYGNQRQLEYDFVVAAGAAPEAITIGFEGTDKLEVDAEGELILHTASGEVRQHKPLIYQEVEDRRQMIAGHYALKGKNEVGFQIGDYDRDRPLVIDPVLVYSTYFGGVDTDRGLGIAVDSAGNAYLTGATMSTDLPTKNPLQATGGGFGNFDAFVAKLNPSGSALLYSTYLGGSSSDQGSSIAIDPAGNVYITGQTTSTDFPTKNPIQATNGGTFDAFVAKLNPSGSALLYSTYLGGSNSDQGFGIAVDPAGNAYVTGETTSTNFPTKNPIQATNGGTFDAFVAKLSVDGSALSYSTYLGGNGSDQGFAIAVDSAGNAYVTGETSSTNFPTKNPLQADNNSEMLIYKLDAFVAKINSAGSALVYSTYLGGSRNESGFGIAVDSAGDAYVTGDTNSNEFPTVNPLQSSNSGDFDIFVAKLNPVGNTLLYSTYFGGSKMDRGSGIALDLAGNIYVVGETTSANFPTKNPIQAKAGGGLFDIFVVKLSADGSTLSYSTYLGGNNSDRSSGIAVDSAGNAYVTGYTPSLDFPTANPLQANKGGDDDAFVVKISDPTSNCPTITISPVALPNGTVGVLYSQNIMASSGAAPISFAVTGGMLPGGLTLSSSGLLSGTPTAAGSFTFLVIATDANNCTGSQILTLVINEVAGDFTLSVTPVSQIVMAGASTSFTANVQSTNGLTQPVNLSATINPSNANIMVSPLSAVVAPGNNLTFTVNTTAGAPPGRFNITFTGTVGKIVHNQSVMLVVTGGDFALSINPAMLNLNSGGSAGFTANVQAVGNFTQPVSLSLAVNPPGENVTVNPESAMVTPGSSVGFTVSSTVGATGMFTITATGSADQIVHTATATVNVLAPDFRLAANPQQITVSRGQSSQFMININRTGGFNGSVTVSADEARLKLLKIKVTPLSQSTTGASVGFNLKVKRKAPVGAQQLTLTGQDDTGRIRTAMLTLMIE